MLVRRRRFFSFLVVVALAGAGAWAWRSRTPKPVSVHIERVELRDLQQVVAASGKIQPRGLVNISADTMGRVTELAVAEGDFVTAGQFLLQIDPRMLSSTVQHSRAGVDASESALMQARVGVEATRVALHQARQTLTRQEQLSESGLTSRETLELAQDAVKMRETELREREQNVQTQALRVQQEQASLSRARYDLSKVRLESPITGIVTRRTIQLGETVVIGTMNNPGTVLMTIADMSVVQAEVEIDETDIPNVKVGQPATIIIDAIPHRTFTGKVTEIANSPVQGAGQGAATTAVATNFKVVVSIVGQIPDARPGFTCTVEITTATRTHVKAVPIQATAVREVRYAQDGSIIREAPPAALGGVKAATPSAVGAVARRAEEDGVFVLRNDRAEFVPIRTGIVGDRHFEVLAGLEAGDVVIVGPFEAVRDLRDGVVVKVEETVP